mmetsp:Transcript_1693/g.2854  ORF Transcript_1693/g.2854 Transcript_1693/m.2854 type:complete len:243 (+) Transcript_1693:1414-2142(+)
MRGLLCRTRFLVSLFTETDDVADSPTFSSTVLVTSGDSLLMIGENDSPPTIRRMTSSDTTGIPNSLHFFNLEGPASPWSVTRCVTFLVTLFDTFPPCSKTYFSISDLSNESRVPETTIHTLANASAAPFGCSFLPRFGGLTLLLRMCWKKLLWSFFSALSTSSADPFCVSAGSVTESRSTKASAAAFVRPADPAGDMSNLNIKASNPRAASREAYKTCSSDNGQFSQLLVLTSAPALLTCIS